MNHKQGCPFSKDSSINVGSISGCQSPSELKLKCECSNICILDLDSPSYPPTDKEMFECACNQCFNDLVRRGKIKEPRTAAGSLD